MSNTKPWGELDYLLAHLGDRRWRCVASSSFEPRCEVVPAALHAAGVLESLHVLKIDPPSDAQHRDECKRSIERSLIELQQYPRLYVKDVGLLESLAGPLKWLNDLVGDGASIILDISAMPKRYFMFFANKLMDNNKVQDLVITYARPASYPEGPLASDHDPISSLSGFMREDEAVGLTKTIIGAGFMQFSLSEYMEQADGSDVSILLPFPPGAPSSRRNWNLLHKMDPNIEMRAQIRRIHAMDFFQALAWMNAVISDDANSNVDLIPLGPKPHSLAMALAYRAAPSKTSVLYAQPHSYRSDYSVGVGLGDDRKADIYAYCLRRSKVDYV